MRFLCVDEIEELHAKLADKITSGNDLTAEDVIELFDNHSHLIRAYRRLEDAFVSWDYNRHTHKRQLEFLDRAITVTIKKKAPE
jgi:hypothetical protein